MPGVLSSPLAAVRGGDKRRQDSSSSSFLDNVFMAFNFVKSVQIKIRGQTVRQGVTMSPHHPNTGTRVSNKYYVLWAIVNYLTLKYQMLETTRN